MTSTQDQVLRGEQGAGEPPGEEQRAVPSRRELLGKTGRIALTVAPLILLLRPPKAYAASHVSS